ncbi:rhodanese-like domain-containing protein [Streptomyces sp. NPDC050759]|uniref:rhodanese-like domain-containing protein n=1 Tax=Streptomyces sp. NPDC050759 TaxID=3365635 RepID=UPI0037BAD59F
MARITAEEAHERTGAEAEAVLLDVREHAEWAAGHAPGAVHAPLSELASGGRLPRAAEDRPVVTICRSGKRSREAAGLLAARGVDAVDVLGGMRAWVEAGLGVVGGSPGGRPASETSPGANGDPEADGSRPADGDAATLTATDGSPAPDGGSEAVSGADGSHAADGDAATLTATDGSPGPDRPTGADGPPAPDSDPDTPTRADSPPAPDSHPTTLTTTDGSPAPDSDPDTPTRADGPPAPDGGTDGPTRADGSPGMSHAHTSADGSSAPAGPSPAPRPVAPGTPADRATVDAAARLA